MNEFIRVGVDLGKGYFQIHALSGAAAVSRKLSRPKVRTFFARLAPCRIGMEACGSAHYWARELAAMGHEVVLTAPAYIKPYVKRGKNGRSMRRRSVRRCRAPTCGSCRSRAPISKPC